MVCPPTTAGRWLTEQLLRAGRAAGWVLALPRLQLLALKLPPPGGTLLALQLTVPLGALAELGVLSVTVPVQLVGLPTGRAAEGRVGNKRRSWLSADPSTQPALLKCVLSPP